MIFFSKWIDSEYNSRPGTKDKTNPTYFPLFLPLRFVLLERGDKEDGCSFYVSHHQLSGGFCVKEKDSIKLIDGSFLLFVPWPLERHQEGFLVRGV